MKTEQHPVALNLRGERPPSWWTGLHPAAGQVIHSPPQVNLATATREDLLNYFNSGWLMTEVLFSALQTEDAFTRAPYHNLRHPLIFYYAHPAVLYVNKLRIAGLLESPVNSFFEHVFEVGVDEMSWDDMTKNEMTWPAVRDVTEYRRQVYEIVKKMILTHPALDESQKPFLQNSPVWALAMGFEHERIHLETSSVLIRELPLDVLRKPAHWPSIAVSSSAALQNPMLRVEENSVELGKPQTAPFFGWDNEYGSRIAKVAAFEASRTLITNGEFLSFVRARGYQDDQFWSAEGLKWRKFLNTKWPTFWVQDGPTGLGRFKVRGLFENLDFDEKAPVVVNFHEAEAFCKWRSSQEPTQNPYRLTTENEHHRLRQVSGAVADRGVTEKFNFEFKNGGEIAVDASGSDGFTDVFGNLWQWCEDDFNPLPGFRVHPYYEDFSTPCFDGKHKIILGGSFASCGDEAGPWARFHFRAHFFQHAGFRLARSIGVGSKSDAVLLTDDAKPDSSYESKELLNQYLLLHFGGDEKSFPAQISHLARIPFPKRCADIVVDYAKKLNSPLGKALDVGCAVGGAVFELAKTFDEVTGVDLSQSFIATAQILKSGAAISYARKDEGNLTTPTQAVVPTGVPRERTNFMQADATSLPAHFLDFDAVLMANLLCRLPSPRSLLARFVGPRAIVRKGGLFVLVSPYSWLPEYTPEEAWLGGFERDGKAVTSSETIQTLLKDEYELLHQDDFPLVIREHARKYQYIISHLMVWRRR